MIIYETVFGFLPKDSAQKYAIDKLAKVRYGTDKKDYYWIIDTTPVMIMHPYRKDLVGKYVGNFKDEKGKRLFQEAKQITSESGEGYIRYMWQWQDDSLKLRKNSFVKIYKPW
jgi:signal transduction histidine kinase